MMIRIVTMIVVTVAMVFEKFEKFFWKSSHEANDRNKSNVPRNAAKIKSV
jgi:hypothetical protein